MAVPGHLAPTKNKRAGGASQVGLMTKPWKKYQRGKNNSKNSKNLVCMVIKLIYKKIVLSGWLILKGN